MAKCCSRLCESGLSGAERLQLASVISKFFHGEGFPGHKQMDLELANHIAQVLPDILCTDEQGAD